MTHSDILKCEYYINENLNYCKHQGQYNNYSFSLSTMLKKLISPLQKILVQRGYCPGCTSSLKKAQKREQKNQKIEVVICKCGRAYVHDKELDTYRRALDSEV